MARGRAERAHSALACRRWLSYKRGMSDSPQIIVLFSGGLDSLLTAMLLERQGLRVRCLHFYSPFFGGEALAERWR